MNSISKKYTSNKRKTKYLFALMSDINLTEGHQKLKLAEKHLKEAKEKNARISENPLHLTNNLLHLQDKV